MVAHCYPTLFGRPATMTHKNYKNAYFWAGLTLSLGMSTNTQAELNHSPMLTGFLGLNTLPSARMDKAGTVRAGISTLDPYLHSYVGVQIADPLFVNIRQSAEVSNPFKGANRLYPGVDFKLRLAKENAHRPEIALGVQSALGHRRQSGEFIAASKRYNNFDLTAGLGWGRYGTASHFKNPLKFIGDHFDAPRDFTSESPNTPSDWFTGEDIGIFAGIEYFLPLKGLSLKLDYGADHYSIETQQDDNFERPSPWGIGLSYAPKKWINAGFGIQGKDKITARLSLKANPENWKYNHAHYNQAKKSNITDDFILPLRALPDKAPADDLGVDQIYMQGKTIFITLHIPDHVPTPQHLRKVIEYIEIEHEEFIKEAKEYAFTLKKLQLEGTTIRFLRSEALNMIKNRTTSPQELWSNSGISAKRLKIEPEAIFLPTKGISKREIFNTTLENHISLSEEDAGTLYRSSLLLGVKDIPFLDTINGTTFRFNLAGNNENIDQFRPNNLSAIRSDLSDFSNVRLSLEHSYIGTTQSLTPQIHFLVLGGYLEELYAGIGGEILYRPFDSRLAYGLEFWRVNKRLAGTVLNQGLSGQITNTAFANLWYDIPKHNVTANIRAGQFIAGDHGAELGLEKRFQNGAILKTKLALSDKSDIDPFGDDLHAFHSINLVLPFGTIPYLNASTAIETKIEPFARNAAQTIDKAISLYELTEPFTLKHIAKNWDKIAEQR